MKPTQHETLRDGVATRGRSAPARSSPLFVITLCTVPVPISIPRPRSRRLLRFSFYSSLRRDAQQERYWVHMGYFATRAEAQRWRKIHLKEYPHAFVSEAHRRKPSRHCEPRTRRLALPEASTVPTHFEERPVVLGPDVKIH